MIVTLILAALAAVFAVMRGGSLDDLAATRFRLTPVLVVSLVLQLGVQFWSPAWLTDEVALAVLLGSNAGVGLWLAANFHLPGMAFAAVGMALNVIVIAANGAMPVSQRAANLAGYERLGDMGSKHELLDEDTLVPWLADVIPIPYARVIISLGDVVLAMGIARLVYVRTAPERRGKHRIAAR